MFKQRNQTITFHIGKAIEGKRFYPELSEFKAAQEFKKRFMQLKKKIMMKIIDPIDRKLIKEELNAKTFIRSTRKGGNEIYIVNNHNAPNVLKEIGRLREITFRASGGGTEIL